MKKRQETKTQAEDNFKNIFSRIGHLTRFLRDSLVGLGLDQAIMDAAEALPDARDRLDYVVKKTTQAADMVLTCVEQTRPLQEQLTQKATQLTERWSDWFDAPVKLPVARELVIDTRQFLTLVPEIAHQTDTQLMDIMMAQDFQDLTGQVIQRMMSLFELIEKELIHILAENIPETKAAPVNELENLKNGPQIDHSKDGVVVSQNQVDDLLESLGF